MKKSYVLCSVLLFTCLISCKKELTQPEAVNKINVMVSSKDMTKATFEKELLPIVNDLYEQDRVKYRLIHHIALKAQQEKRNDIFKLQIQSLKAEMKFVDVK
jgi:hypothetical protein